MIRPALLPLVGAGLCLGASTTFAQTTLLDPGAEPRRELRYEFEEGAVRDGTMDMDVQMNISMLGQEIAMPIPTIRMQMTVRTTEVADDGTARFEFEYTSAEVIGDAGGGLGLGAMLGPALSQIGGVSGWMRIDPRGQTLEAGFDDSAAGGQQLAQVLDSAEQSIQQMSAPWPAEPVGVGAQWQVQTMLHSGGYSLDQTATYTLESINRNEISVAVSLTQTSGQQSISGAAGLPPGAEVNLMSMDSTGSGNMRVDVRSLVPVSQMNMSTAMVMGVAMQGQSQQMSMNMNTQISISPGRAAP